MITISLDYFRKQDPISSLVMAHSYTNSQSKSHCKYKSEFALDSVSSSKFPSKVKKAGILSTGSDSRRMENLFYSGLSRRDRYLNGSEYLKDL